MSFSMTYFYCDRGMCWLVVGFNKALGMHVFAMSCTLCFCLPTYMGRLVSYCSMRIVFGCRFLLRSMRVVSCNMHAELIFLFLLGDMHVVIYVFLMLYFF